VRQKNRTRDGKGRGSVPAGQPSAEANGSTKAGGNGSGNGQVAGAPGDVEEPRTPPADAAEVETAQFVAPAGGEVTGDPPAEPTTEPTRSSDDAESAPTVEAPAPAAVSPAAVSPAPAVSPAAEPSATQPPAGEASADAAPPTERLSATQRPTDPETERLASTDGQPAPASMAQPPVTADDHAPAEGDADSELDSAWAVPAPGPAAAAPPPWRRLPEQDGAASEQASVSSAPAASGLLDDGPTAFLEVPPSALPDSGPNAGDPRPGDTGSWARVPRSRPPRQAALQLKRLDPWSVLKLALVLAVVLFFIWLVAVGVLYGVLDGMGVWDRLNGTYADLISGEAQTGSTLISAGRVFGLAAVIGAINSLLFAVAVTVGAFVYNVSADLVGGIEVILSERD
jgi:Transmembrane domain of unknown function (DUF3566)